MITAGEVTSSKRLRRPAPESLGRHGCRSGVKWEHAPVGLQMKRDARENRARLSVCEYCKAVSFTSECRHPQSGFFLKNGEEISDEVACTVISRAA